MREMQNRINTLQQEKTALETSALLQQQTPEPLRNEFDIAMYVKKYIDDPDGYDGIAFSRYLADLKRTGKYIDWEEMI